LGRQYGRPAGFLWPKKVVLCLCLDGNEPGAADPSRG
jgi:hypothetical protein